MLEFAPIYGEWSEKYCDYKYKSLSICAEHFGIKVNAHDSLEDTRATLACFQEIQRLRQLHRLGKPQRECKDMER